MKPLLLRLFGVAQLDFPDPGITLLGMRNADHVRDILRTGRQLGAQRTDKIGWR